MASGREGLHARQHGGFVVSPRRQDLALWFGLTHFLVGDFHAGDAGDGQEVTEVMHTTPRMRWKTTRLEVLYTRSVTEQGAAPFILDPGRGRLDFPGGMFGGLYLGRRHVQAFH